MSFLFDDEKVRLINQVFNKTTMDLSDWVEFVLSHVSHTFFRAILVVMLASLSCLVLFRFLILIILEAGQPIRPSLHYRPSSLSNKLISSLPTLTAAYTLPFCWSILKPSPVRSVVILIATATNQICAKWTGRIFFLREFLLMEDNGLVSLDWAQLPRHQQQQTDTFQHQPEDQDRNKSSDNKSGQRFSWIVILLPGLWVCHSKKNLQSICRALVDQGHRAVIWNRRGQAGTPLTRQRDGRTSSSSSSVGCSDLHQVIQYLSSQHPNSPLALVGFSHSASLLISYLGEYGSSSLIHCAVAVSPIWHQWPAGLEWISWIGCRDDSMTKVDPLSDSDDIAVPLLVIHYDDDPLVPANTLPRELFTLYPQLMLVTCPLGGHCGQLQSTPLADVIVADFIREVLSFTSWPLVVLSRQQRQIQRQLQQQHQQQQKEIVESLARSPSRISKSRRRNQLLKNGRPSCNSC